MTDFQNNWQIWVDTGGTFTDVLGYDPEGNYYRVKVLSKSALRGIVLSEEPDQSIKVAMNWDIKNDIFAGYKFKLLASERHEWSIEHIDFERGFIFLKGKPDLTRVINGIEKAEFEITAEEEAPVLGARLITGTPLDQPLPPMEMRLGTTRGTNALLEQKGGPIAFVITRGFSDLLNIGTQQRPELFQLNIQRKDPLPKYVFEVDERMDAQGNVEKPLNEQEINRVIGELKHLGIEYVAVALLHSYANPAHEVKFKQALISVGINNVSTSSGLASGIKILPRAETAVVNAYLEPVMTNYLNRVLQCIKQGKLKVMTSSGGLVDAGLFHPKDSLLSGPAGGVVGAASVAKDAGYKKILTLDMGGTSSDVARYDGKPEFRYETRVGDTQLLSPSMAIETVAAGGGSICKFDGMQLQVGPESAGAHPGPASYGAGGPLAVTDVNLLLGRLQPEKIGIPVVKEKAGQALSQLKAEMKSEEKDEVVLSGLLDIANEKMADAIRNISVKKGYDAKKYALLAFGGAGGQHACGVAELLQMEEVVIPYEAGLLSAYGMGRAEIERFASRQILKNLEEVNEEVENIVTELKSEACNKVKGEGFSDNELHFKRISLFLRLQGQDNTLEIPFEQGMNIEKAFEESYRHLYGHWVENRAFELESILVVAANKVNENLEKSTSFNAHFPNPENYQNSYIDKSWQNIPVFVWEALKPGATINGPALLTSNFTSVVIYPHWQLSLNEYATACISYHKEFVNHDKTGHQPEEVELALFTNRFKGIAEEMGALLQRTSFSVNIKERMDFSCALLDPQGSLVANAPHIPVHLGSLGICVRKIIEHFHLQPGDIMVTNHPGYGGSHLPDITLVAPVHDDQDKLIGFVANRSHHAELGGKTPGSMPTDAQNLAEEGVLIKPTLLVSHGKTHWSKMEQILTHSHYPTRALEENLADLQGAIAAIHTGKQRLEGLVKQHGKEKVDYFMGQLREYARMAVAGSVRKLKKNEIEALEYLDDGTPLSVKMDLKPGAITVDFSGTGSVHRGNLNATSAIVNSAIIYVLRLLLAEDIPLNEGIMADVSIKFPDKCLLNPDFSLDPEMAPAVVGGNTETSQRLVDTLLKGFQMAACSQGTMNNLLLGNERFGYYETIGGGTGAGEGFNGAEAVHQHMTNTRITDPEIMEFRYPVKLEEFSVRKHSGGAGKWKGGNGIRRKIKFLEPVTLTLLSQHRKYAPYGMQGGSSGQIGEQLIIRGDGKEENLKGIAHANMNAGDQVVIHTPGGGGFGKK